eukprot:9203085-Alexandrium_andersonii.AAC.1
MDELDITHIVNCTHASCPDVGQPIRWHLQPPYRWRRQEVSMGPTDINAVIEWWTPSSFSCSQPLRPTRASWSTAVQARAGQRLLFAPCS